LNADFFAIGLRRGEGVLERARIDFEEEVALVDVLTFLDVDLHQRARDLGADRGGTDGLNGTNRVDQDGDNFLVNLTDKHGSGAAAAATTTAATTTSSSASGGRAASGGTSGGLSGLFAAA
jgi:hypothetical protein